MTTKLNDRQCWLLIYLLTKHPIGISANHGVPHSCDYNGRYYGCPGGLGMANLRGLERRGYVTENAPSLFRLTENGILAAQDAATDSRWVVIESV
jgi:hypothetical protein